MPIAIQQSLAVSGSPLKRKTTIVDFVNDDMTTYFRLSKQDPTLPALLGIKRLDTESQRNLSHTDIIETVAALRTSKYNEIVAKEMADMGLISNAGEAEAAPALSFLAEEPEGEGPKVRPTRTVLAKVPETAWSPLQPWDLSMG